MERIPISSREARIRAVLDRLFRTMRLHHRLIDYHLDGLGIHHGQHRMLMRLSRMGRAASQKDIAEALEVSPACVARTLKALSAAGLIEKAEGADSRRREIEILPEGQRMIDDSLRLFQQIDDAMFDGISDEEIACLTDILNRLHCNLAAMEGGAAPERSDTAP